MNDNHQPVEPAPRSLSRLETFERLASPIPDRSKSVPLPPLTKTRKLTHAEEVASVEHLYTQSLEHKKVKLQQLEASIYSEMSTHTQLVDPEELNSIVSRLYEQSISEKQSRLQAMTQRRMMVHHRKVKKFGSNDELVVVVDRLFNTSGKEKERSDALFEKYNPPLRTLRHSKQELDANDERYYKGGFAKKS